MIPRSHAKPVSGQGALEYLLLIGGAVLVATIVLVMIVGGIFPSTGNLINGNLNQFQHTITINAAGGGGGPGAQCPDGGLDAGEQCDGSVFFGGSADCSAWGAFLPGTNVTCNTPSSCTVNTSACTPTGGSAPSFVSFTPSTGVGAGRISVAWNIANFSGTDPNEIKGFLSSSAPTIANTTDFDNAAGAPFDYVPLTANGSQTADNLASYTGYTFWAKACNLNGCTLTALGGTPATSSRDTILLEAESFVPGVQLDSTLSHTSTTPPEMQSVMGEMSSCVIVTAASEVTATATVNLDTTSPAGYRIWARGVSEGTAGQRGYLVPHVDSVSYAPGTLPFWLASGALDSPFAWVEISNSAVIPSLSGGSHAVDYLFTNGSGNFICSASEKALRVDKFMMTSDTACTPAGDGSNCI